MRLLQESLCDLGIMGRVIASDINLLAPAMHLGEARAVLPPYRNAGALEALLQVIREHSIQLLIPTIDPELPFHARHRDVLLSAGCHVNISSERVIAIGEDKLQTHRFLCENHIPTVRQWLLQDALRSPDELQFPMIVKPRSGSASIGLTLAADMRQLEARAGETDLVVQTLAPGREYTVDVYVDGRGRCRCAVPRLRLETRGGEVSKAVTVRNPEVIKTAQQVAEALPGAFGVLNIQMFYDEVTRRCQVIEINPRFGGGYPLTHQAGAPMTRWLLEDILNLPSTARDDQWREGVVMLRYDEAVFLDSAAVGLTQPGLPS